MRLIEDKLLEAAKNALINKAAEEIKAIQKPLYDATTQYWGDAGDKIERRPEPKFIVNVRKQRGFGCILRVRSYAQNKSTKAPHKIWHMLDGGTGAHVQKNTSPPIRERRGTRTKVGDLNSNPFPGFTGKTFVILAGRTVRGIPARHWYEKISEITLARIQGDVRFRNAEITKVKITRPKR